MYEAIDDDAQIAFGDTTEHALGLPGQPPETCPIIDELIDLLGETSVRTDLCEAVRQRAMDIRSLGQAWKDECLGRMERSDPATHARLAAIRRDRELRAIIEGFAENLR